MEDRWDALLGDLYLAAVDPAAEARVAPALACLLGGATAALWMLNPLMGVLTGRMLTNLAPEGMALYASGWYAHDPWTLPLARRRTEGVMRGTDLIADEALARSEFYAEFGRRTGAFHVVGSVLPGATFGSVGAIAAQRPRRSGAFGAAEVTLLARLLPHARRSLQLDLRLRAERLSLLAGRAALDGLEAALIVLDGTGRVLHANRAAEGLDRASVVSLRRRGEDDRIATFLPADTAWLRHTAADAARGGAGGARRLVDEAGRVWMAVVTPLPRRLADRQEAGWLPGMAMLVLRSATASTSRRKLEGNCTALFGMTAAEAEVAALLYDGHSPEEIAARRNVRLSTVRTLLKRAVEKSGATSLRDLVRILGLLRI